jgi:hypothetical protein
MNKLFRLLFLILAIVSQSTNSQTPAKELKGWAGSPEEPAKAPQRLKLLKGKKKS